jgi:sterol desaturase/sphingolipid hydroxylase (fatty acid hydroxylase superfamily)
MLRAVAGIYQHANVAIPKTLESYIRLVFITSDMHRIHHSTNNAETDTNYGGIFSFWDRLLGTYFWRPIEQHPQIVIGLDEYRSGRDLSVTGVFLQPFRRPTISK